MQGASEAVIMSRSATIAPGVPFVTLITILLAAGAMIQRWLSDIIDDKGIGDGIGLLLSINIVSSKYAQLSLHHHVSRLLLLLIKCVSST